MNPKHLFDLVSNSMPVEWQAMADRWISRSSHAGYLPPVDQRGTIPEAIERLDAMIIKLARFRAYLDTRHGSGCGTQPHADAVKASNQTVSKIRKALGYTYPDRYQINF